MPTIISSVVSIHYYYYRPYYRANNNNNDAVKTNESEKKSVSVKFSLPSSSASCVCKIEKDMMNLTDTERERDDKGSTMPRYIRTYITLLCIQLNGISSICC